MLLAPFLRAPINCRRRVGTVSRLPLNDMYHVYALGHAGTHVPNLAAAHLFFMGVFGARGNMRLVHSYD